MAFADNRRGATLLELLAALSLAGVALLGAHALLSAVAGSETRVTQRVVAGDELGMGFRRMRDLLLMAEAVESGSPPIFGDARGASFTSSCRAPGGWLEHCRVDLQIAAVGDSVILQLREDGGRWVRALALRGRGHLSYLDRRDGVLEWRNSWGTSIARPVGVALIVEDDTLGFVGGAR